MEEQITGEMLYQLVRYSVQQDIIVQLLLRKLLVLGGTRYIPNTFLSISQFVLMFVFFHVILIANRFILLQTLLQDRLYKGRRYVLSKESMAPCFVSEKKMVF